ncbi:MAG: hypothetical protein OXC30_00365 [Alphaproteobacteria bacterium]|nr:hypothetical protein [Alphaproteobacteria bacterium]
MTLILLFFICAQSYGASRAHIACNSLEYFYTEQADIVWQGLQKYNTATTLTLDELHLLAESTYKNLQTVCKTTDISHPQQNPTMDPKKKKLHLDAHLLCQAFDLMNQHFRDLSKTFWDPEKEKSLRSHHHLLLSTRYLLLDGNEACAKKEYNLWYEYYYNVRSESNMTICVIL